MMRVREEDVKGAYRYLGLFYAEEGRVISNLFIQMTKDPNQEVICYDFAMKEWFTLSCETCFSVLENKDRPGELTELDEMYALWYLETEEAFNGEGDDKAVEALIAEWTVKKEEYRDAYPGWPAKLVETTFYLKGKKYSIKPEDIGLDGSNGHWGDEGFMEFLQSEIGKDLKKLGATEIRHFGFLD